MSEVIGAERGERTPDRATHRNGYRPRESAATPVAVRRNAECPGRPSRLRLVRRNEPSLPEGIASLKHPARDRARLTNAAVGA